MATMAMAGREMEQMQLRPARHNREQSLAERNRALYEAQRGRRRGATPEMFFAKHIDNTRLIATDDPIRKREMRRFSVAMCFLFLFTMTYVWQHLSSIETGYKVEIAKQQVEKLQETNRQLRLQEAQLSDPGRIDTMARQLGLDVPMPGQVVRPNGDAGVVMAQVKMQPVAAAN